MKAPFKTVSIAMKQFIFFSDKPSKRSLDL